jgi:hypothetical protein
VPKSETRTNLLQFETLVFDVFEHLRIAKLSNLQAPNELLGAVSYNLGVYLCGYWA